MHSRAAWDEAAFVPQSMRIRHATHGDLTYSISTPARFMFYDDRGRPRLAVEVETDDPPADHPLAVLGPASIWIRGIELPAPGRAGLVDDEVIACDDWLEDGGRVAEYVVFNLHDTLETRDTAVRFLGGGSRIQIVTLADDVVHYDERARRNPVYVDAVFSTEPTELADRVND
jgi:hypothetical protein